MKEKFVIVFIAVALGLIITTVGFLIYQSTKITPENASNGSQTEIKKIGQEQTTPKDTSGFMVTSPDDESLTSTRTITVKGTAQPGSTIVISSNSSNVAAQTTNDGKFSATITIDAGANKIVTEAINADGSSVQDERIVTYSTDDF
jgi:hypothetical protein